MASGAVPIEQTGPTTDRLLTLPNIISIIRLGCIPIFLWLLFGRDDRASAAWLLGGLGATDWVDGWIARRFAQVSELGKVLDPTADRLLFIVGVGGMIIDGAIPLWFAWLVVAREAALGIVLVVTTLLGMQRFDVSYLGKLATFLLMFAFPGFLLGASDFPGHTGFNIAAWIMGIPGLVLSYYTAVAYVPLIRRNLRDGRARKEAAAR
ncbi:MAG: CDP-alcohol phosphatidyltransferase family protein [Acidimicrobiia bacterium]